MEFVDEATFEGLDHIGDGSEKNAGLIELFIKAKRKTRMIAGIEHLSYSQPLQIFDRLV